MALELKMYLWQKMKPDKPQNVAKIIVKKIVPCVIPKITSTTIVIDHHMVIFQVQIRKNIMEDVLLDGGSININTKQLKLRLGLPKLKPIPYNLRMANQTATKLMGLIHDLKIYMFRTYLILLCLLCNRIM
jgi:hypothetical protein